VLKTLAQLLPVREERKEALVSVTCLTLHQAALPSQLRIHSYWKRTVLLQSMPVTNAAA
jgi:hypothetical protein